MCDRHKTVICALIQVNISQQTLPLFSESIIKSVMDDINGIHQSNDSQCMR